MDKEQERIARKIWKEIEKYNSFFITGHINPDHDCISSLIIMGTVLKTLGKKYNILIEKSLPSKFNFLIERNYDVVIPELLQVPKGVDLISQLPEDYFPEVVIILDTASLDRLGEFAEKFDKARLIINIDHHEGKRRLPSKLNLVDVHASSTGELLYKFLKINNFKITKNIAELVYISIIGDTYFFSQPNTSADVHKIAAELIELGVSPSELIFRLFSIPFGNLPIYGEVLKRIKSENDGKIVYSYILKEEIEKAPDKDLDGLIEMMRSVDSAVVAVLFKQLEEDKIKVSMRGKFGFNVFKIVEKFGGGGHKQAGGCTINMPLDKAEEIILKEIKKFL